jgi:putative flippase GtrA
MLWFFLLMTTFKSNLSAFLRCKENPYTQFVKYVVCGGVSVGVDALAFYLLAWRVFPCLQPADPFARLLVFIGSSVQEVTPEVLIRNYWIIKGICFFLSNGVVYVLNAFYVFKSGRHHRVKEVLLFFVVSAVIFLGGTSLGAVLIQQFEWHMTYTYIFVLSLGILANYFLRKLVVFKY